MKFYISLIFLKPVKKIQFPQNLIRMTFTVHEDQYIVTIINCSVFLEMRNFFSDNSCRENQKKHFMCKNIFFFRKSYLVLDDVVELVRPQVTL